MSRFLAGIACAAGLTAVVVVAPAAPIDGSALHAMARDAVAAAHGDGPGALDALDGKVRARWGDVLTEPLSVSDAPTEIHLFSPYAAYRKSVAELLKRQQSIDPLAFNPVGIVIVAPTRVDAPDVIAIELRRDGATVAPVVNQLTLRPITSPLGVTLNLHAGYVAFPLAAFAPGAEVVVDAACDNGTKLTLTLDPETLARFR